MKVDSLVDLNRLFERWVKGHGLKPKHLKPRKKKDPYPRRLGNQAERRRIERAKIMRAFERDTCGIVKKVCDRQPFGDEVKYQEGTIQFWKDIFQATNEPNEPKGYGEQVKVTMNSCVLFASKKYVTS